MEEFRNTWKEFSNDNTLKSAVLISAKPGSFIAGADIKMFTLCETEQDAFQLSREVTKLILILNTLFTSLFFLFFSFFFFFRDN